MAHKQIKYFVMKVNEWDMKSTFNLLTKSVSLDTENLKNWLHSLLQPRRISHKLTHWEKRFDWIKKNNLFEQLSLI